jgi:hypothetical protein
MCSSEQRRVLEGSKVLRFFSSKLRNTLASPTLPPDDYDQDGGGCSVVLIATTAMAYFLLF